MKIYFEDKLAKKFIWEPEYNLDNKHCNSIPYIVEVVEISKIHHQYCLENLDSIF